MDWITRSDEETRQRGAELAGHLKPRDVLVLTGQIGAGKTTFVQGIAQGMGADPRSVASPSFILIREYPGRIPLFHVDLFRLEELPEAEMLGLDEYYESEGVTLIEWGRKIPEVLPSEFMEICFEVIDPSTRKLLLAPHGARYEKRDW